MTRDVLDRMLLDYAAGGLCIEETVVISALLALDARARLQVARYEAFGGRVIEEEPLTEVRCLGAVMKFIEGDELRSAQNFDRADSVRDIHRTESVRPGIPAPLAALLGDCARADRVAWHVACAGVERVEVRVCAEPSAQRRLFLMRLAPQAALPPHRHDGPEITLVLEGEYSDGFGRYARGDIAIVADGTVVHSPRAGAEGCLCLVLARGALRFGGPLQRLLHLLSGF